MSINVETHEIWRLFFHSISLKKKSSLIHRYPTHEVDEPYRWSNSVILRLPGSSKGLTVGWWRNTGRTEEQALIDAMEGRKMDHEEFSEAEKTHIRRNLIKKQFSAEQQQLLVEVLDL